MAMIREEVVCNYVGSFKVGDNLVYNSNVLCDLAEANRNGIFNKPIVLQAGSLLEASLAQIIYRAQNFNREGVPNISEEDRLKIAGEKADKFFQVINVLQKYEVLTKLGNGIYDDLHKLRKYRNKIHIQDDVLIEGGPRDEIDVFSNEICEWALDLHCNVVKFLSENFARPEPIVGFVNPVAVAVKSKEASKAN